MAARMRTRPLLLGLAMAPALSACMLGPDYVKPPVVAQAALEQPRLSRAGQEGVVNAPPPQRWWDALQDAQLTALVDRALANSPDLHAAEARLDASRALVRQRHAERMPSVGAGAGYVHARLPESVADSVSQAAAAASQAAQSAGAGEEVSQLLQSSQGLDRNVDVYGVGFDASWELDLFGRRRRAQQEAQAQAEADQAQLADAQVQLAAEVGKVYANYRGTQQRLAIARDSRDKAARMLELTRQRRERGAATQMDVERTLAQLRQQEATIPDLQATVQESLDQLALMTGQVPGSLDAELAAAAPLPSVPVQVPVDDAGALIRRRPDVRQAERQLAASSAKIGQALSGYFPQVMLVGTIGAGATSGNSLGSDSVMSMVAPFLQWSVLDFGKVKSQVAQARAGNQAYAANYESKVLAALQDANSALARFGASRQMLAMAGEAADSATRSADLVQQRYQAGATSLIDALDVQRQQLSARDSQAQIQTKLLVDYISLQKSLGLGWGDPAGGS